MVSMSDRTISAQSARTGVSWRQPNLRQAGVSYLATSDSGLYRIDNSSVFGMSFDVTKLPYPGVDGWSSVGVR